MMAFCKHRVMDKCGKDNRPCIFSEDCFEPEERKPLTNADRIRAMSDEELAELLLDGCRGSKCDDQTQNEWGSVNCFQCRVTWLQQPEKGE